VFRIIQSWREANPRWNKQTPQSIICNFIRGVDRAQTQYQRSGQSPDPISEEWTEPRPNAIRGVDRAQTQYHQRSGQSPDPIRNLLFRRRRSLRGFVYIVASPVDVLRWVHLHVRLAATKVSLVLAVVSACGLVISRGSLILLLSRVVGIIGWGRSPRWPASPAGAVEWLLAGRPPATGTEAAGIGISFSTVRAHDRKGERTCKERTARGRQI